MIFAVSHEWTEEKKFPCKNYWKVFEIDKLVDGDILNYAYWGTFKAKINSSKIVTMETDHCFVEAKDEIAALKKGKSIIATKYNKILEVGKHS